MKRKSRMLVLIAVLLGSVTTSGLGAIENEGHPEEVKMGSVICKSFVERGGRWVTRKDIRSVFRKSKLRGFYCKRAAEGDPRMMIFVNGKEEDRPYLCQTIRLNGSIADGYNCRTLA